MKKLISLFLAVLFFGLNVYAQEKWNQGPEKMQMAGIGKPSLPAFIIPNYINPNTRPRVINSPKGIYYVNPNTRVHPNNSNYQSETYLTRNPVNPSIMFGAANAYTIGQSNPFMYSTGYYITTNGGASWYGNDTLNSNMGDPGPILDKNGVMIMTYLQNPSGIGSARSTNNGLNWSAGVSITFNNADKNLANTDEATSSSYYGRSYVVWSYWTGAPPIVVSYTTNSGVSWSVQSQINTPPSGHYSQGCDIVVNNSGVVYVTWAAPILGSPYTEDYFGFAKSTNGGVNWTVTENAFDGNGIRGNLSNKNNLRVNSFPRIDVDKTSGTYSGRIYIVTSQKNLAPAGSDADIVLHYSTNGGTNWSAGVRVNQDALNNGKTQWFPVVKVNESGVVHVAYYDDRNVMTDSAEVYVSRSYDGGDTWTDLLVSDARFKVVPISESGIATGYGGDYIGMACANSKVWPFWMDRRTGVWQVFTTSILEPFPLYLKVYLEGMWNGVSQPTEFAKVYLANALTPYAFVDSVFPAGLSPDGTSSISFSNAPPGNYYIVVKQFNHLETWSKLPIFFTTGVSYVYDFTTAANKAYGDNMKQVGSVWVFIGGDINQDGIIDALDRSTCWNDRNTSGIWLPSDINGDQTVDALDRSIIWNNRNLAVQKPALAANPNTRVKQKEREDTGRTYDLKFNDSRSKKVKSEK